MRYNLHHLPRRLRKRYHMTKAERELMVASLYAPSIITEYRTLIYDTQTKQTTRGPIVSVEAR